VVFSSFSFFQVITYPKQRAQHVKIKKLLLSITTKVLLLLQITAAGGGIAVAANVSVVSQTFVVTTELTKFFLRPIGIEIAFFAGVDIDRITFLSLFLHPVRLSVVALDALRVLIVVVVIVVVVIR